MTKTPKKDGTSSGQKMSWVRGLRIDPYIVALLGVVVLASVLPARGEAAVWVAWANKVMIGLLFFLHGARMSTKQAMHGLLHWRLHATVLAISFVAFPLIGLALTAPNLLSSGLSLGLIFLCCLPSTVQSSIAFTAVARGNVAAAVTSASVSNLAGIALTPLLVSLLTQSQGLHLSASAVEGVVLQLLAPFIAGQLARRWIGPWVERHRGLLSRVDRSSIFLVVYAAFGAGVADGVWGRVGVMDLALCGLACVLLLAAVMVGTVFAARRLGFDKADEIVVVFCGSKKSLATGAPMAGILFAPAVAGVVILPVIIYHQIQLIVCAVVAQRYRQRTDGLEPARL